MAAPAASIITRVAYGLSQLLRVAWYLGHGLALRRLAEAARRSTAASASPQGQRRVYGSLCRGHHREVHRSGDEAAWWDKIGIDATAAARTLWLKTHPLPRAIGAAGSKLQNELSLNISDAS